MTMWVCCRGEDSEGGRRHAHSHRVRESCPLKCGHDWHQWEGAMPGPHYGDDDCEGGTKPEQRRQAMSCAPSPNPALEIDAIWW